MVYYITRWQYTTRKHTSDRYTVKKNNFQDLLSQHFFFCQINLNNLFSSDNLLL